MYIFSNNIVTYSLNCVIYVLEQYAIDTEFGVSGGKENYSCERQLMLSEVFREYKRLNKTPFFSVLAAQLLCKTF